MLFISIVEKTSNKDFIRNLLVSVLVGGFRINMQSAYHVQCTYIVFGTEVEKSLLGKKIYMGLDTCKTLVCYMGWDIT